MPDAMQQMRMILAEIYDYWFGSFPSPTYLPEDRKGMWFTQSDATDAYIRTRFLQAIGQAAATRWDIDALTKQEQVALVVLLDQFPRNLFRGTAQPLPMTPRR